MTIPPPPGDGNVQLRIACVTQVSTRALFSVDSCTFAALTAPVGAITKRVFTSPARPGWRDSSRS